MELRAADRTLRWLSSDLRARMVGRLARHARSRADAEDAYQAALAVLAEKRDPHGLAPEGEPTRVLRRQRLVGFLYVVAKRFLIRQERRRQREPDVSAAASAHLVSAPGLDGDARLDGYLVRDVLMELSADDRQLLSLRAIGCDTRELAERLGIGADAAEKRLQRARERFRQRLRERGLDPGAS